MGALQPHSPHPVLPCGQVPAARAQVPRSLPAQLEAAGAAGASDWPWMDLGSTGRSRRWPTSLFCRVLFGRGKISRPLGFIPFVYVGIDYAGNY